MGNYIIVNKNNYEMLIRNGVISINKKIKGTSTDFGEFVISYNVKK